jgi:hypothetical protein
MIPRRKFWLVVLLVMIVQAIPFLVALSRNGEGLVFGGFVLNPLDGNSYLAKMQQGWLGDWRFRLPYTANPGEGAYLFLFYMVLGHVARLTFIPVVWMFHLARLFACLGLFFSMASFLEHCFPDNKRTVELGFFLALAGGGMGWLVLLSGYMPADVWVAEGYPFLSMFNNPHFPLGLALMLYLLQPSAGSLLQRKPWIRLLVGLLLAVIQPFGLVIVVVVAGIELVWRWWEEKKIQPGPLLWSLGLGGPFLLYQFVAIWIDPVLAGWNAQNLTPAPPLWDFLLSLSPALIFAIPGAFWLVKERHLPGRRVLVGWLLSGIVLTYLPFNLQRRFMTGFYVPVVAVAIWGITHLLARSNLRWRKMVPFFSVFSILTNALLMIISILGVRSNDIGLLYLTTAEQKAMVWIKAEIPINSVIAASTEIGTLIPAHTGRRVVYGHPFETVDADVQKKQIESFLSGIMDSRTSVGFIERNHVSFLFYGPREKKLGAPVDLKLYRPVYDSDGITILAVNP